MVVPVLLTTSIIKVGHDAIRRIKACGGEIRASGHTALEILRSVTLSEVNWGKMV